MEIMNLKATLRETVGNGPSRALRREGKVPAILYGPNTEPVKLTIDKLDLEPIFKSGAVEQKLEKVDIDGADGNTKEMVKEIQKHKVYKNLLNMNFYGE